MEFLKRMVRLLPINSCTFVVLWGGLCQRTMRIYVGKQGRRITQQTGYGNRHSWDFRETNKCLFAMNSLGGLGSLRSVQ